MQPFTLPIALATSLGFIPAIGGAVVPPCQPPADAVPLPAIELTTIAQGLDAPLLLGHSGDRSGRLFIVEQQGTIRVWQTGGLQEGFFLDIRDRVASGGEKGLLGLAFHPQFASNGRFFVNYTSADGGLHTVIAEFRATPDHARADQASERILLTVKQPYGNHNGGNIAFGPDGRLYIGMGDGGAANDPHGHGQNLKTLLGAVLRIDVNRTGENTAYAIPPDNPFVSREGAAPEIWAYGLRNPWRFSFDAATGRLYAGDVGQNAREEIDVIVKGKNYGWNRMEGTICTPGVDPQCDRHGFEPPIVDYPRSDGTAVIGGYVYRGATIPPLCGTYLYGDFGSGRVWGVRVDGTGGGDKMVPALLLETGRMISSFGEDEAHELYLIDHDGDILKIVASKPPLPLLPGKPFPPGHGDRHLNQPPTPAAP